MSPQQAAVSVEFSVPLWSAGDFSRIAAWTPLVGELLCESVGLHAGERVLDVATGSGNTAMAAARRHCAVAGIDCVPGLLERARQRASVEGLDIVYETGDAGQIPFPDAAFDVVLSTFGSMFVPDQELAAAELARVCRPGGRIGLANWAPNGFIGHILRASSRPAPLNWGEEGHIHALFEDCARSIRIRRRMFCFHHHSPESWIDFMKTYYGPMVTLFRGLDRQGAERYQQELLKVIRNFNRSGDGTLAAPAEYLEVTIARK